LAQLKNSTLTETSTVLDVRPTNHSELDQHLLTEAQATLATGIPLQLTLPINHTDCAVGAPLAAAIADRFGEQGLPDGTVSITFHGCAGQKFGAYNTGGLELTLIGKAGDYVGQAMAGGQIVVRPSLKSQLEINNGRIAGNSVIEGASGGSLFVAGQAGKFFARHNRGAIAVVEGVGGYACTEMVDGVVVVLGQTGEQFGLRMYGGMGFVLDTVGNSATPHSDETTPLPAQFIHETEQELLKYLVMRHVRVTGSVRGQEILADWSTQVERFRKFAPPAHRDREGPALDRGFLF
jgi:glutamate synthase (ferredoxin)